MFKNVLLAEMLVFLYFTDCLWLCSYQTTTRWSGHLFLMSQNNFQESWMTDTDFVSGHEFGTRFLMQETTVLPKLFESFRNVKGVHLYLIVAWDLVYYHDNYVDISTQSSTQILILMSSFVALLIILSSIQNIISPNKPVKAVTFPSKNFGHFHEAHGIIGVNFNAY